MSYVTPLPQGLSSQTSQTALSTSTVYPVSQPSTVYPVSQPSTQNYLSRVPSLPENMYGTSHMYPPTAAARQDTAAYYPLQNKPADSLKAPSSLGQHYYVDHMMKPHPYSSLYPFDINAVRRKNATRETTGPLKAWLKQHRANPYPTKGEKVMLAIATRMTLTQVSTWFANARRRMKKDKFEDEEEEEKEEQSELNVSDKNRERSGSMSSGTSSLISSEADTSKDLSDLSDAEDIHTKSRTAKKCVQRLFSPDLRTDNVIDPSSSPESLSERVSSVEQAFYDPMMTTAAMTGSEVSSVTGSDVSVPSMTSDASHKSKIWSISEIIGSASHTVNGDLSSSYNNNTAGYGQSYGSYQDYYSQISFPQYSYTQEHDAYSQLSYVNSTDTYPKSTVRYL